MADEPTQGELYRMQIAHEQRTDHIHASLDDRITALARDTVSQVAYQADQRARDAEVQVLREDIKELRERPQMTMTIKVAVWGVLVSFLGVVVTALALLRGSG